MQAVKALLFLSQTLALFWWAKKSSCMNSLLVSLLVQVLDKWGFVRDNQTYLVMLKLPVMSDL